MFAGAPFPDELRWMTAGFARLGVRDAVVL